MSQTDAARRIKTSTWRSPGTRRTGLAAVAGCARVSRSALCPRFGFPRRRGAPLNTPFPVTFMALKQDALDSISGTGRYSLRLRV